MPLALLRLGESCGECAGCAAARSSGDSGGGPAGRFFLRARVRGEAGAGEEVGLWEYPGVP